MDRWWTKTQCTYPQQEPFGSPKFLVFLSTHATLFVDPGRPSESSPIRSLCAGFWYRYTIATCIILGNEAVSRLQGVRSPLWPMWFPVYASAVSFGFCLLHNCNTRYGWLVRPFPSGTFTLQETPSFLAHNGCELSGRGIPDRHLLYPLTSYNFDSRSRSIPGPFQRVVRALKKCERY